MFLSNVWQHFFGLSICIIGCASVTLTAQEAEFTALGTSFSSEPIAGRLHLAEKAPETLVVSEAGSAGVVAWSQASGWQAVGGTLTSLHDVSEDGSQILSQGSGGRLAIIQRTTGTQSDLPPFPTEAGYGLLGWIPIGFHGEHFLTGLAVVKKLGVLGYNPEVRHLFRLNLATAVYELLADKTPAGAGPFSGGVVSREAGCMMLYADYQKIWIIDGVTTKTEQAVASNFSLSGLLSRNGRWLFISSDAYKQGMNVKFWGERWDLEATPLVKSRLSQLAGIQGGYATGEGTLGAGSVLDDGTIFGSVNGEIGPKIGSTDACVWHPNGARVLLQDELQRHYGLNLEGWKLKHIMDASGDGRTLVGYGINPQGKSEPWLLQLSDSLPVAEPAPELWGQLSMRGGSASELSITFPSTPLNSTTAYQPVFLNNIGSSSLEIRDMRIEGPSAAEFSIPNFAGLRFIPVGELYAPNIYFTPVSPGAKVATVTISTNDPDTPEFVVALTGEGPSPVLDLKKGLWPYSKDTINLASVPGRSVEILMQIYNSGNQEATEVVAEAIDPTMPGLEVLNPPPSSLAPNAQATFSVRFTPTAIGAGQATLRVRCNHPIAATASLPIVTTAAAISEITVMGPDGVVFPSGSSLPDFGQVTVGAGVALNLSFQTQGGIGTRDLIFKVEGTNAQDFQFYPYYPVSIQFSPLTAGMKMARLVIDSPSHLLQPYVLNLSGQAMPGTAPQFVTYPRSEINTTSLNEAQFRVLGKMPMQYRVIRNGISSLWQSAGTVNTVSLNLTRTNYSEPLQIELSNSMGTVKSPLFRRMNISLSAASLTLLPKSNLQIQCDAYGSIFDYSFEWLKDGVLLQQDKVVTGVSNSGLLFNGLRPTDSGRYSCRVTLRTPSGDVTTVVRETLLDVITPPEIVPFSLRPTRVLESHYIGLRASYDQHIKTTYTVTGLPPGIRLLPGSSGLSGVIYGVIASSAAVKVPRDYQVTVKASNAVGISKPFTTIWRVEPYDSSIVGTYHGIIQRQGYHDLFRSLGGSITITLASTGSFSGRVTTGGFSRGIAGTVYSQAPADLPLSFDPPLPSGMNLGYGLPTGITGIIPMIDGEAGQITFWLKDGILVGNLVDTETAGISGFKQGPAPAALISGKQAGRHHFQFDTPAQDSATVTEIPEGTGFAALTIQPTGIVTWSGRLPEGTTITGSSGLGFIAEADTWIVPMHQTLYSRTGSVQGFFGFQQDNSIAEVLLDWYKNALANGQRERLYPGISLVSLVGQGSRYLTSTNDPILDSAFDMTATQANGILLMKKGGLNDDFSVPIRLEKTGKITASALIESSFSGVRLNWAKTTGAFTATATLSSPDPVRSGKYITRSIVGQALWIPHLRRAAGQFILPELASPSTTATTSPIRAGQIVIEPIEENPAF